MATARTVADYMRRLTISQGRFFGQPFPLLGWQRRCSPTSHPRTDT